MVKESECASLRSQDRARRRAGPGPLILLGAELGERLKWEGQKGESLAPSPLLMSAPITQE